MYKINKFIFVIILLLKLINKYVLGKYIYLGYIINYTIINTL